MCQRGAPRVSCGGRVCCADALIHQAMRSAWRVLRGGTPATARSKLEAELRIHEKHEAAQPQPQSVATALWAVRTWTGDVFSTFGRPTGPWLHPRFRRTSSSRKKQETCLS